jgi:hypothetical protein
MGNQMNILAKEKQEIAYDDWVNLLHRANAEEEFLTNPKAVWLEAWTQATMIAWSVINDNVPPKYQEKVNEQLKLKLLK